MRSKEYPGGLSVFTAEGLGLIPGRETKIPQAARGKSKGKKKKKCEADPRLAPRSRVSQAPLCPLVQTVFLV